MHEERDADRDHDQRPARCRRCRCRAAGPAKRRSADDDEDDAQAEAPDGPSDSVGGALGHGLDRTRDGQGPAAYDGADGPQRRPRRELRTLGARRRRAPRAAPDQRERRVRLPRRATSASWRRRWRCAATPAWRSGRSPATRTCSASGAARCPSSADEVESLVRYQIGALEAFCRAAGVELRHVKPHGALYNQAATDPALAAADRARRRPLQPRPCALRPRLVGADGIRGGRAGLRFVPEAFADRRYLGDGSPPAAPSRGSVITDPGRGRRTGGRDRHAGRRSGRWTVPCALRAESICCHGDTPGAVEIAAAVRRALDRPRSTWRRRRVVIPPFGEAALLVEVADAAARRSALASRSPRPTRCRASRRPSPGSRRCSCELDAPTVDRSQPWPSASRRGGPADRARCGRRRDDPGRVRRRGRPGPGRGGAQRAACPRTAGRRAPRRHRAARPVRSASRRASRTSATCPSRAARRRASRRRARGPRQGSVGIAGPMSGIYPADAARRLAGHRPTPITLFDARRDPPAYLAPGDPVRFEPIDAGDVGARSGRAGRLVMIEIVEPGPLASVQDPFGRPDGGTSAYRSAVPPTPWSARLANRLVGNDDEAALAGGHVGAGARPVGGWSDAPRRDRRPRGVGRRDALRAGLGAHRSRAGSDAAHSTTARGCAATWRSAGGSRSRPVLGSSLDRPADRVRRARGTARCGRRPAGDR